MITDSVEQRGFSPQQLFRYGLRYVGWFSLAWLGLTVVYYIFPDWQYSGTANGIFMTSVATGMTYYRFIKDQWRALSKPEYWGLVVLSTGLYIIFEFLMTLSAIMQGGIPMPPLGLWLGLLSAGGVFSFLVHAMFYSRALGTAYLKRLQKKHRS